MNKRPHKSDNPLLKECLFTALILLMDQKDFKDITISEITQKAGVSRMTYYRTYSSKEDILLQYFEDQSKKVLDDISGHPQLTNYDFLCIFFTYFRDQAHLIKYLHKAGLQNEIGSRFVEFVSQMYECSAEYDQSEPNKTYEIHFIAGGLLLLLIPWIERGMVETPEEMARMMEHFLRAPSSGPDKKES